MSGRGGRGGHGGRGGRGGAGLPHPVARDDEGKIVQPQQPEGPPPLFPPIKEDRLPQLPKIPPQMQRQLMWRHELQRLWQSSPYFLKAEGDGTGAKRKRGADHAQSYKDAVQLEGPSGRGCGSAVADAAPCTVAMTLHPLYFPEELYTKQRRSARASAVEAAFWAGQSERRARALKAATEDLALGKLEELARQEDRGGAGRGGGSKTGGGGSGDGEEGEEAVAEEYEEEEDENPEDDDYYQGDQVDDDEGYLDDDDGGGGDEGPTF